MSSVASTPVGRSNPDRSAASRPILSCPRAWTPTSSRSGRSMMLRNAWTPTLPVENWTTRRVTAVLSEQIGDGLQSGVVEHARQHAAIDFDGGAIDEIGCARGKEHTRAADLFGFATTLERQRVEVRRAGRVVLGQDERAEVVGDRRSKRHTIDPGRRAPLLGKR